MDTVHLAAPPRSRWFVGLRRCRSRILGGVAGGFADFWAVDPLLVRVLVASPLLAAMASAAAQVILGMDGLGPVTGLLWLVTALAAGGYLTAWVLIPLPDARSVARRFLAWRGLFAAVVKLVVAFALVVILGWLALVALALLGALDSVSPLLLMLGLFVVVAGLATLGVWLSRGGDLRVVLTRLGSPGLGRTGGATPRGPAPAAPTGDWMTPPAVGTDPTLVLATDAEPTLAMAPAGQPGADPTPAMDAVDRARAAAIAAADARAAAAEAARRARAEQRRARRAQRRERNRWGWLVAAAMLVTAGVLVLTDRAGATDLGLAGIGVVCLALLTIGVLVGAWFGSARWLIAPALLLAAALGAGAVASAALERAAAAPAIREAPTSLPADEQASMSWPEGAVTVDLTGTRTLDARYLDLSVDRGSLTVVIPADQWTEVYGEVTIGHSSLEPGAVPWLGWGSQQGHSLNIPTDQQVARGAQPLWLSLRVGVGELTVIEEES